MKGGNKKAASYYVMMLIKREIIPKNHGEAREIIDEYLGEDESFRLYYHGKVLKKERRFIEAAEIFKKSIEMNNIDSMYEYARLLMKGHIESSDSEEPISLYMMAISFYHLGAMYKFGSLNMREATN